MKIHSLVWLIAGIIVALVSWRVGPSFRLFFYLGLLFIIFGVVKSVMWFLKRRTSRPRQKKVVHSREKTVRFVCYSCKKTVAEGTTSCPHCAIKLR